MDPIPVCLAVPRVLQGCSLPHLPILPTSFQESPKQSLHLRLEDSGSRTLAISPQEEPKGVCAKPFVRTRKDKVMGTRLDRLNSGVPGTARESQPNHPVTVAA